MLIQHKIVPWEVFIDVAVAKFQKRLGILLMPLQVQSCVLRLRKVLRVQLGPPGREVSLRQLEVVLAHGLVSVMFPLSRLVSFLCIAAVLMLLLLLVVMEDGDLAPERQVEHVFDLGGDGEAEDLHVDVAVFDTYGHLGVISAARRVEPVRQFHLEIDRGQALRPGDSRLHNVIGVNSSSLAHEP